jgi:hypothetical protein
MKRRMRPTGFGLAVLALLAAAGPGRAAGHPFKLKGVGEGQFAPDFSGFTFTAAGVATDLGRWTNEGQVVILGPDPAVPGNVAVAGEATLTAANGDELYAVITGSFDPATGAGIGVFHRDGGTGRFAGATGTAVFPVRNSPADAGGGFTFEFAATGVIDY